MNSSTDLRDDLPVPSVRAFRPARLGLAAEAQTVMEEARAAGYAAGWAEGRRASAAQAQAELATLHESQVQAAERTRALAEQAISRAVTAWEVRIVPTLDDAADVVADAAIDLAEEILGRELSAIARRDVARAAVRRALAPLPADGAIRVRLNPEDLAALGEATAESPAVEFVPDPSLARGDAVAEREGTLVDARIAAALERARAVARG